MKDHAYSKHWKSLEAQLRLASKLLLQPNRFKITERELNDYSTYIDNNEFELGLDELTEIALEFGCRSGFWRQIQKPAKQMGLEAKAAEYERLFHQALRSEED